MSALTPAQLAILRLVSAFKGGFGLYNIEAVMKDLSGIPESEWTPIDDHLDTLEDLGLIRPAVTPAGQRRYLMTDRGRKLVGDAD